MLSEFFNGLRDDLAHGDDRSGAGQGEVVAPIKPVVLRRRTIYLIALLGIAAIGYGTMVPFQVDWTRPLRWRLGWCPLAPGDTVVNVLIYVPIGAFLRLMLRRRGSFWLWEGLLAVLVAGLLSYLTEVVQTILPARVASWSDTLLNTLGALIGVILAPLLQRGLRNLHAYLYFKLRCAPLAVAATVVLAGVCTYALAPPDFYPSPRHVTQAVERLWRMPDTWLWVPGLGSHASLGRAQIMDKIVAAGSYGLLAFVLLLSAREAGRSIAGATWYALSRSAALATVIEALQLFTISHAADLRDLASAGLFCGAGSAVGGLLVWRRPLIHRHPHGVLRGLVTVVAWALLLWTCGALLLEGRSNRLSVGSWLPMVASFDRSWNGLLGDYVTGFLQYALLAGLVVLWYRSDRRSPWSWLILLGTLTCALLAGAAGRYCHRTFDTAQLLLAGAGAVVAIRLDRAIFGKRADTPAPAG